MNPLHTMKTRPSARPSTLRFFAAASTIVLLAGIAQGQTYLRAASWFNPSGAPSAPYTNVSSAVCVQMSSPGQVIIQPGTIYESVTIDTPTTFTAPNGPATIDSRSTATTTIRVGTYNVRLWPSFFLSLTLADQARANLIGPRLDAEDCDVIGLQEVWDYRLDSPDASGFINALTTGYPNSYYGDVFSGNANNSGLLTMCRFGMFNRSQGQFAECDGDDCSANKGWIRSTFIKNGFNVTVYNTHTQSGSSSGNQTTRSDQLTQMASDILAFRIQNPSHAIIVVGDFNISRSSAEFTGNMSNIMGGIAGLSEGGTNLPCTDSFSSCTSCSSNTIKQIFGNDQNSTILDYILYAGSWDGTVKVIPTGHEVKTYRRTDGGEWCRSSPTGCANDLSDHEAVFMNFQLRRVTP